MPGHVSEKELQTESLTGLGATTSPSMPRERQRDIENIEKEKEFQQFLKDTGRNERNPYGNEGSGIFGALSRKFPGLVTYDNILSPQQIALQNRLAFDRYKRPFAKTNILGQQTGADIGAGIPRMGVQPGMRVQTPDGRVVTAQAKPLSGITAAAAAVPYLGGVINFLAPKQAEIPGFEADNPMDTGANIGEDRQSVVETAINKLRDTFSQSSSKVTPTQEVSPIQNVEPVGPTVAEAILDGSPMTPNFNINEIPNLREQERISDLMAQEVLRQAVGDFRTARGVSEEEALAAKMTPEIVESLSETYQPTRMGSGVFPAVTDPFGGRFGKKGDAFTNRLRG